MFLRQLWLWNFRNYEETSLVFETKLTLLQARNSQGKTNLLEAIYYLSSLSSPRCQSPQEMIRHGSPSFSLKGRVEDRISEKDLAIFLGKSERILSIGGKRVTQAGRYWNKLPAVMFRPDDLALVTEGDEARRRFLDRCAALEDPSYLDELSRLRRVLAQRNRLLKERNKTQLPFWDEQLAQTWKRIHAARGEIVLRMNRELPSILSSLGEGKGSSIRYRAIWMQEEPFPPADLAQRMRDGWEREMRAGFSLFGPHRDEVMVDLGGHDARRFSSRGEKRSLTLSWKLFELSHLERICGEPPVVLLDDLFSELDEERRAKVASRLLVGQQAVVTCTDQRMVAPLLPGAGIVRIHEGRVESAS